VGDVRADLGNEQIVDRQRRFEEWWFGAFAKMAVVTNRVAAEGLAVNYLYRDPTDRENDSGWCVFHGDEDDAYLDDARNSTLLPLRELIRKDKALEDVFRAPAGTAFERDDVTGAFSQVEAHRPRE
jgi:hypothetical protein